MGKLEGRVRDHRWYHRDRTGNGVAARHFGWPGQKLVGKGARPGAARDGSFTD
jgi:hypothetical protein